MAGFDPIDRRSGLAKLTRLVSVSAAFGLVLIVLGGVALAWEERQRFLRDAASRAESTAFFLADHAGRLFEVADVAMGQATSALGTADWDAIEHDGALRDQLKAAVRALPYVEDVWLNDQQGKLRLTSFAFPTPPSDASGRLIFRLIGPRESGLVVGDRIIGRVTQRATFLVARRLSYPDGKLRGMVSATADLAYFDDYWQRLRLPYDAQVSLRRTADGEVLASFPVGPLPFAAIEADQTVSELPLLLRVAFSREAVLTAWRAWIVSSLPFALVAFMALAGLSLLGFRQARREAEANGAIARAQAALAAANAGLEETVARRTAELREANEEVKQFAYLVSHDLRAPLVNILGFTREVEALGAELLQSRTQPISAERWPELEQDLSEAIGFIQAGSTKMDRLLNHILMLAREGKRVLRPELVDMTALLHSLASALSFQAGTAGASIEIDDLPPVTGDRLALEQVFGNLLDNAVKYLGPAQPGRVAVSGSVVGEQVVYEVSDNGRGIVAAEQAKVFEMFRRVGDLDRPGDGMGLAHVRALVRNMGGQISLRSEPGAGSTFTVTLPNRRYGEIAAM